MSDYDTDLYEWTKAQADALRRRATNEVDWDNVAEEIESLGRSDRREIGSRLENLLLHLLKWKYQPEWQCGSWRGSLYEARRRIKRLLDESPSLRSLPGEYLPEGYAEARARTLQETGLLRLPERCPWTIEQILDPSYLP
ncbi:MAG: DUF29 domain-containing protein [Hyphomicrobiales bacterium]|nr:DUF29 domain-containing protein [Hyphomicrobiales bacterium]